MTGTRDWAVDKITFNGGKRMYSTVCRRIGDDQAETELAAVRSMMRATGRTTPIQAHAQVRISVDYDSLRLTRQIRRVPALSSKPLTRTQLTGHTQTAGTQVGVPTVPGKKTGDRRKRMKY